MDNSIAIFQQPCTGCGACSAVCPRNAIRMDVDEKGFYVAHVGGTACIDCGLCQKVCIRKEYICENDIRTGKLLSMESKDPEVIRNCTSGGIAYEMAIDGYRAGKVIVGTIYDYSSNTAKSVIARSEDDILAMRGSKYIQSHTEDCIKKVFEIADTDPGKEFIVFGTPCQIYAYSRIAERKRIRERFLLVDLFCHGVPSALVWECYLIRKQKQTGIAKWDSVRFRDSYLGWHNFILTLESKDLCVTESSDRSLFYHAFFDNVLLSTACFNCQARCHGAGADIRLGDFWGKRYQQREDGVSAVLCLTDKGREAVVCNGRLKINLETSVEECLQAQSVSVYPNLMLHERAIEELRQTRDLKKTIRHYRMSFPVKKKLVLAGKSFISYLPTNLKLAIKAKLKGA